MNIFLRFIVRLLYMAGTIPLRTARRMNLIKTKKLKVFFAVPMMWRVSIKIIEPKATHGAQIEIPLVEAKPKTKRERPPGATCAAVLHVLEDATIQTELFKWIYDPMYPKYREWTLMGFLIKNASMEERRHDRRLGNFNFRSFDKEKFKPEEHSQKVMGEAVVRKKKRVPSIMKAEGAIYRGTYPSYLRGDDSIMVENGKFPENHSLRPIPVVSIETLT
jgi:hypothetical protein